jgi:hypothetical protein
VPPVVPSYIAKLSRAEKHLVDLKAAIEVFGGDSVATRPYTVSTRIEGKKQREVHRLLFTRSIANTEVPLIFADAVYNLRSGLDHLAGALVPAKDRRSVMFPIFWRGVWEPEIEGENEQRQKDRQRWNSIARRVQPGAAAFLKRLQPPDDAGNEEAPHGLRILNQLSNADRHTKLPVYANGVEGLQMRWKLPDGSYRDGTVSADSGYVLEDNAEIRDVPKGAVYVEGHGTPRIVVRTAMTDSRGKVNLPVVDFVTEELAFIRNEVVPSLLPYLHEPGGA